MDIFAFRVSGQHQKYEVGLSHATVGMPTQSYGLAFYEPTPHVRLQFNIPKFGNTSNPLHQKSERFLIAIEPAAFTEVAHAMVKADPQAAIRAFGAAMQTVDITEIEKAPAAARKTGSAV